MFENMTYESILKNALARVRNDVDKREGSIIYDALAPACAELAQAYISMENVLENSFADTACREYLILRARERGIEPYKAASAVARGVFDREIPIGSRYSIGTVNFEVTEKIQNYEYKMVCETPGSEGNGYFGTLIPIGYVPGSGVLTEILVPGRDEEDTEDLRKRYFENIYGESFGGNKADYRKWVKAIDGVGQVRVKRAENSNPNVKVYIWGAGNTSVSDELINNVKEILDPAESSGYGEGIVPIGHSVEVKSTNKVFIAVEVYGTIYTDADLQSIKDEADAIIREYFDSVNEGWETTKDGIEIYSAQIVIRLLEIKGIKNIDRVLLNGDSYVKLPEESIAGIDYVDFLEAE